MFNPEKSKLQNARIAQIRSETLRNEARFQKMDMGTHPQQIRELLEGQLDPEQLDLLINVFEKRDKFIMSYHREMLELLSYLPVAVSSPPFALEVEEHEVRLHSALTFQYNPDSSPDPYHPLKEPLTIVAGLAPGYGFLRLEYPLNSEDPAYIDVVLEWKAGTLELRATTESGEELARFHPLLERNLQVIQPR